MAGNQWGPQASDWQAGGQPGLPAFAWQLPGQPPSARLRSPGIIVGGIFGLAGVFLILLGSLVPWVHYPGQKPISIFPGFPGAPFSANFWYAIEPGGVAVLGLVASIMLLASSRYRPFLSGLLAGFGVQSILLFGGYTFAIYAPTKHEPGGPLGLLGGVALFAAGVISFIAQNRQPADTVMAAMLASAAPPNPGINQPPQ